MYKAVLFAPDGDWVTDYRGCRTIDEVWEHINNQGSRWYFYPIACIIRDRGSLTTSTQRVISVPDILWEMEGKSIKSVRRWLASLTDEQRTSLLS